MKLVRRILIGISAILFLCLVIWNGNQKKDETKSVDVVDQPSVNEVAIQPDIETEFSIVPAIDQTEPMEHEHFVVKEYVSVLPTGTNIALDGKIEANGNNTQFTPMKAIDGKTDASSYWEGVANTYPAILTLDVNQPSRIHAVRICLNPASIWGDRTQTFSVLTSTDGETYTELVANAEYKFSPTTGNEVIIEFDAVECQFIQLQFTANTGATGAQVAEVEVYSE